MPCPDCGSRKIQESEQEYDMGVLTHARYTCMKCGADNGEFNYGVFTVRTQDAPTHHEHLAAA